MLIRPLNSLIGSKATNFVTENGTFKAFFVPHHAFMDNQNGLLTSITKMCRMATMMTLGMVTGSFTKLPISESADILDDTVCCH